MDGASVNVGDKALNKCRERDKVIKRTLNVLGFLTFLAKEEASLSVRAVLASLCTKLMLLIGLSTDLGLTSIISLLLRRIPQPEPQTSRN